MSSRVTRSATKLAADPPLAAETPSNGPSAAPARPASRKRKTPPDRDPAPEDTPSAAKPSRARRAKKPKIALEEESSTFPAPKARRGGAKQALNMAKPG